jgi:hypothetical protein
MAVRRAKRQTSAQRARTRAKAEGILARETEKVVTRALAKGMQGFALRSMNSLAQAGPAWSGEFSASWGFAPAGVTPNTPGMTGRVYRYTGNNVPVRDVERYIRDGVTRFNIVNTSPHASIAVDQEEGLFYPAPGGPIKEPVQEGWGRPSDPHMRFQIGQNPRSARNPRYEGEIEEPNSKITAERDWFQTYLRGGQLQQDLNTGFSFGFESAGGA